MKSESGLLHVSAQMTGGASWSGCSLRLHDMRRGVTTRQRATAQRASRMRAGQRSITARAAGNAWASGKRPDGCAALQQRRTQQRRRAAPLAAKECVARRAPRAGARAARRVLRAQHGVAAGRSCAREGRGGARASRPLLPHPGHLRGLVAASVISSARTPPQWAWAAFNLAGMQCACQPSTHMRRCDALRRRAVEALHSS